MGISEYTAVDPWVTRKTIRLLQTSLTKSFSEAGKSVNKYYSSVSIINRQVRFFATCWRGSISCVFYLIIFSLNTLSGGPNVRSLKSSSDL